MTNCKSACRGSSISEKIIGIDQFGRPFEFVLPNGSRKYKSLCGAIMTLATLVIVTLYAVYKCQLLISRDQFSINLATEEGYYNERESVLNSESGVNFAVGIYSRLERRIIEDESYGKIRVFQQYQYGVEPPEWKEFSLRPCKEGEIPFTSETADGIVEDTSGAPFFPVANDKYLAKGRIKREELMCLEHPLYEISGDPIN